MSTPMATLLATPLVDQSVDTLIDELIGAHRTVPGALLPLLHAIQDRLGFIPPQAVTRIAKGLNLSKAEVHGVISYYHHFRSLPPGRHVVQICRAEACQACGSEDLVSWAQERLGCRPGETSPDGAFTLESVYCLGLCATSPAIQVNDRLYARVSPEKLHLILTELEPLHPIEPLERAL